ncbi:MAG: nucleotide sugar dehydrogenase [Candidatus Kapabacteria bacterium]|nr:nucleotide sugar dehydrogenase [Candidatus Kapabacteria bacterium]
MINDLSIKNSEDLLNKISKNDITVTVIGLGYVGLPLAIEFAKKNIKTYGIDVDLNKVNALKKGENYIKDINDKWVSDCVSSGYLIATDNFEFVKECDVIFICVPTPFTANKEPDISYIVSAAENVSQNMRANQVIILKSTTFPGTTTKNVLPILEASGLKAGSDFWLAFSPERIDPGNQKWNTSNTPIVVGGLTDTCTKVAAAAHNLVVEKVVTVSTPEIAEMEKLLENIFRSVNIALVNELAKLCDRIGINIWEVVSAAATKPFGFMPFYPGPGIGGHCILIDPYYLAWMAREYDFVTNFITLAAEINEDMPFYVRQMVIKEIAKQPIIMSQAKVLILGMAFKRDVDDLRHSPALKVAELLLDDGINNINYHDPYIPEVKIKNIIYYSTPALTAELVRDHDIILITTDHSVFDFNMVSQNAKVVIDTRNACKDINDKSNIVLLGDGK